MQKVQRLIEKNKPKSLKFKGLVLSLRFNNNKGIAYDRIFWNCHSFVTCVKQRIL